MVGRKMFCRCVCVCVCTNTVYIYDYIMDMFEDGFAGMRDFRNFISLFVSESVESYTGSQVQSFFLLLQE